MLFLCLSLLPFVLTQGIPGAPCVGWPYGFCVSSCFCLWCPDIVNGTASNETGVCYPWMKNRDKCEQYFSIHDSEECESLINQMAIIDIILISIGLSIVLGLVIAMLIFAGLNYSECGRSLRRKFDHESI